MTSCQTYQSFFLSLIFLLFLCVTPSFSSDIIEEVDEVAINIAHPTCAHKPENPYTMQDPPE